jgi:hypothetical protein
MAFFGGSLSSSVVVSRVTLKRCCVAKPCSVPCHFLVRSVDEQYRPVLSCPVLYVWGNIELLDQPKLLFLEPCSGSYRSVNLLADFLASLSVP